MFTAEYKGINSFLVGASNLLLEHGVKRITRGHTCWELPAPFMFKITNPTARWITIPQRKWNKYLPYAESLWLASGRNDLGFIRHYLKRMEDFSDDGLFLRGGYGPRLRCYNGEQIDYKISDIQDWNTSNNSNIDQFKFVVDSFNRDINTRQAIINIGDPQKDCFEANSQIKETKDYPCTRVLHFMKHPSEKKLNLTVYMRSNDILWGASAVNIFNFTFIQEYFASILGLEVGDYYHIANSFHYYEEQKQTIRDIASITNHYDECYFYKTTFRTLVEFNNLAFQLAGNEQKIRNNNVKLENNFEDDFFYDWFNVFIHFHTKKTAQFKNPLLNELFRVTQ